MYNYAILYGTPYRISLIRKLYEELFNKLKLERNLQLLNSQTYSIVFGDVPSLKDLIINKNKAIANQEYELAAKFRDKERALVQLLLSEIEIGKDDSFFLFKNDLYQIA